MYTHARTHKEEGHLLRNGLKPHHFPTTPKEFISPSQGLKNFVPFFDFDYFKAAELVNSGGHYGTTLSFDVVPRFW